MSKLCEITVNGECFMAYPGDVLLDAAQINGIDVPHDCRSGHCGSCVVRLLHGRTLGGEGPCPGTVHACQARVVTDVRVAFDDSPAPRGCKARVATIEDLAGDVAEVTVVPSQQVSYLPGQYLRVQFAGFPERLYSPTIPLDNPAGDGTLRFHVKRLARGRVSSGLGREIRPNHSVKLCGPYGSAYFRRSTPNRMVLVAGGTGFAPIWSIADAALSESGVRPLFIVVGVRSVQSLYMTSALELLATCGNVTAVVVSEEPQNITNVIRVGRPSEFLPSLRPDDIVYAAGPSAMTEAVKQRADDAGAQFYADPFLPSGAPESRWFDRLIPRRRALDRDQSFGASGSAAAHSLRSVLRGLPPDEPSFDLPAQPPHILTAPVPSAASGARARSRP